MENEIRCNCKICNRSREIQENLNLIGDVQLRKRLSNLIESLDVELEVSDTDLGRLEAIIRGDWPGAEKHMADNGWFRAGKVNLQNVPVKYEVITTTAKGNIIYQGIGVMVEATNLGGKFLCVDGAVREVRCQDKRYPGDKMTMLLGD